MSERTKRRVSTDALIEQLLQLQKEKESITAAESALKLAKEALDEPPRHVVETKLTLEWTTHYSHVYSAWCNECSKKSVGYQNTWLYCPICGSLITEVAQETSPQDRLNRDAVNTAMAEIVKAL